MHHKVTATERLELMAEDRLMCRQNIRLAFDTIIEKLDPGCEIARTSWGYAGRLPEWRLAPSPVRIDL